MIEIHAKTFSYQTPTVAQAEEVLKDTGVELDRKFPVLSTSYVLADAYAFRAFVSPEQYSALSKLSGVAVLLDQEGGADPVTGAQQGAENLFDGGAA